MGNDDKLNSGANENGISQETLSRSKRKQREMIVQLVKSMKTEQRMKKIEIAMNKQTAVLDQLLDEHKMTLQDDQRTERRIGALELASARQAVILREINEAVQDISSDTSDNADRLKLMETVASQQKTILNQLLITPHSPVVDPEMNDERITEIEDEILRSSYEEDAAHNIRRRKALFQIESMAETLRKTRDMQLERSRLTRMINAVNDPPLPGLARRRIEDDEDTIISPSSRTMAWWHRLNSSFGQRRRLNRQRRLHQG